MLPEIDDYLAQADFDGLADLMVSEGLLLGSPSGLHGYLSGYLAAGQRLQADDWIEKSCAFMQLASLAHADNRALLLALYKNTLDRLQSDSRDFDLILPDEDALLAELSESLRSWCLGFVQAFTSIQSQPEQMATEAREALEDMGEICLLDEEIEEDEESLADLMEIRAYVRGLVRLLFAGYSTANNDDPKQVH